MKNLINKTITLACTIFMLNACDLDEFNPSVGDTSLNSFSAWAGLQAYCYSSLNDELYSASDWLYLSEGGTDLWVAKSNGTSYKQLFNYEDATSSYNTFQKVFKQCYSMISNCNTVINEASNLIDGDPNNVKVLVAETKVLRALFYSILVTHYGPITLQLNSSSSLTGIVDLYPKRSSEKDIYEQIFKDLNEAIPDLGIEPYEGNYARATKKTAIGLLARAYAQRAGLGDSKYGDGETYWTLAKDTAEDLINNASSYGAYLYTDIADMWADANNRRNKESLFSSVGPDATLDVYQYMQKNNKLLAYSAGSAYGDFFASGQKTSDKGYFYGRMNSQNWMPSEYLMYCFDPQWDRRWEYSFIYAYSGYSMTQCGWVAYDKGQVTLTETMCTQYGLNPENIGKKLYPYADCDGIPSPLGGNQYPAKIWPKGDHSGDPSHLLSIAPSVADINKNGYAGTTKAYAVPYPVEVDDNRFSTIFVHEPLSEEEKAKALCPVVCLRDIYGSNGLPYGTIDCGSEAGNPPLIGDGLRSSSACPSLHKFNWSYEGVFVGSDLQKKTGDMYIMRMAEVYLLAAEAWERLGNGSKAAEYLNVLRKRAAREGTDENKWKLSTATEDDIMDEYARELCGEFTRWALLKRHNAFEDRLGRFNKRAAASFKSYHYNRPISYEFLSTILNKEEYGDNGYGSTANSGLENID